MHVPEAKIVLLGAQAVGKTSFIHRYVGHMFEEHTSPTIGASFFSCRIRVDNHELELLVWDTAGQERFRSMGPMYYRKANAAILMFDITCHDSFESMKEWVTELEAQVDDPIVLCVVGNKCDMNFSRKVGFREASEYAFSIGALYHECSARSSKGVEGVFMDIAQELIKATNKKESKEKETKFQAGEIIRVSQREGRNQSISDEDKSFLCC